jgi:hypothetical protein
MAPTEPIDMVLREFASACSQSTWNKAQVLIVGTLLTRGRHTVAAAIRQMGLSNAPLWPPSSGAKPGTMVHTRLESPPATPVSADLGRGWRGTRVRYR